MITLTINNDKAYVWNATDWLVLREKHRIIGELVGCLPFLPRQESLPGLPLALLPEEVTLLVEQKIARVVKYPTLFKTPSENVQKEFVKYRESIRSQQVIVYTEERTRQVEEMIDSIVEGKRRKMLGLKTSKKKKVETTNPEVVDVLDRRIDNVNRDHVLREELAKIKTMDESHTIVQIFTAHPWHKTDDEESISWNFPESDAQQLRYHTFKNLWEKGYYITPGHKFGVDYLVYPGDPIKFHAQFLVICFESSFQIPILDVIALGRLGTSVRKTVVMASWGKEKDVVFQSLKWDGKSR